MSAAGAFAFLMIRGGGLFVAYAIVRNLRGPKRNRRITHSEGTPMSTAIEALEILSYERLQELYELLSDPMLALGPQDEDDLRSAMAELLGRRRGEPLAPGIRIDVPPERPLDETGGL